MELSVSVSLSLYLSVSLFGLIALTHVFLLLSLSLSLCSVPVSLPLCICVCVSVTVSFVVYLPVSLHKANSRDRLCLLDIFFSSFYYSAFSPSCSSLLPRHPLYLQFHFFLYTFRPFSSYSDDRLLYLSFLPQFCFLFRSSIAPLPFWSYFLISATLCLLQVSLPHLSLSFL